jgi:ADP-ribose pyrophosphatase YjhB (NUDIX family)
MSRWSPCGAFAGIEGGLLVDGWGLVNRPTKDGQPPYWTAPGGGVEPTDASVEEAMRRELHEEIGANVSAAQQVFLTSSPAGDAGVTVQYLFVCRLECLDVGVGPGPSSPTQVGDAMTLSGSRARRTARWMSTCNRWRCRRSFKRTGWR